MGNAHSSEAASPSDSPQAGPSSSATAAAQHQQQTPSQQHQQQLPQRAAAVKESIGSLSSKATPAPPAASLESAVGSSHSSVLQQQQQQSRQRSSTQPSNTPRPAAGENKIAEHVAPPSTNVATSLPSSHGPTHPPLNVDTSATSSPAAASVDPSTSAVYGVAGAAAASDDTEPLLYPPSSQFGRPPRLPLPIEEETHVPDTSPIGSPNVLPVDAVEPISAADDVKSDIDPLDRTRSLLSATTQDDEEEDDEDVVYTGAETQGPLVDTLLEWKEGGDKVYVTGTFCGWLKKSRLHRHGPSKDPNAHSAIIALPAGALYLSFLVDGVAKTARHMPTTVDYTNALVNYLQVPAEGEAREQIIVTDADLDSKEQAVADDPSTHMPSDIQPPLSPDPRSYPEPSPEEVSQQVDDVASAPAPDETSTRRLRRSADSVEAAAERRRVLAEKQKLPDTKLYHSEIPPFLLDWDAPENSSRVRRANAVSETHQPPPLLPAYLQKSILSAAMPLKDDASVLAFPNHTVLNHLATSSIKDGTLGTSATTRYQRKFVTSIMYMPTSTRQ